MIYLFVSNNTSLYKLGKLSIDNNDELPKCGQEYFSCDSDCCQIGKELCQPGYYGVSVCCPKELVLSFSKCDYPRKTQTKIIKYIN